MRIGILTGSGTYALPGIDADGEPELVETRFGSAPVTSGRFARRRRAAHLAPPARATRCSPARSPTRPTSPR